MRMWRMRGRREVVGRDEVLCSTLAEVHVPCRT